MPFILEIIDNIGIGNGHSPFVEAAKQASDILNVFKAIFKFEAWEPLHPRLAKKLAEK